MKDFTIVRVVTRDAITDSFQGVRNMFGFRLRGYESRITKTITQMQAEMRLKYPRVKWYRIVTESITNGSVTLILFGVAEDE